MHDELTVDSSWNPLHARAPRQQLIHTQHPAPLISLIESRHILRQMGTFGPSSSSISSEEFTDNVITVDRCSSLYCKQECVRKIIIAIITILV